MENDKRIQKHAHDPYSWANFLRLVGLTVLTGVIYTFLKIQGKLRM